MASTIKPPPWTTYGTWHAVIFIHSGGASRHEGFAVEVLDQHLVAASPCEEREEQPPAGRRDRQAGDAAGQNAINIGDRLFGPGREAEEFDRRLRVGTGDGEIDAFGSDRPDAAVVFLVKIEERRFGAAGGWHAPDRG